MQMNLLTEAFRIRMTLRAQLRQWSVIWTLCAVGSLGVCSVDMYRVFVLRGQLAEVRQRAQATQEVVIGSENVNAQLAELAEKTETLRKLQPADHGLPLLGMLAASAMHSEHNIHIHKFVMQSDRAPQQVKKAKATANAKANDPSEIRSVVTVASIHGIATSDQAVSQLVDHMRSYNLFRRVDLKSTSVLSNSTKGGREFHVECHY